jgi:hypothetical protein
MNGRMRYAWVVAGRVALAVIGSGRICTRGSFVASAHK